MATESDALVSARPAPERLSRGVLNLAEIATSTMANIAPAMSFYFSMALIAGAAGVASPLTIITAAIAIALLGNTLAQFTKSIPSTGSFITFIGKAFGPVAALTTAIVMSAGYIVAVSSVVAIAGGWTSDILAKYAHVHVAWQLLTAVLTLIAFALVVRGVSLSTKWAGALFGFEMLMLVVVSVWVLADHSAHLNLTPFEPSHLLSGWKGLGLGFPIAVYMFIGWENSASLAEETANPRRQVPRAIFLSIALMAVSYILFAYVTVVGYNYDAKTLSAETAVPFVVVAQGVLGAAAFLAYLAGFTSIVGSLIAATNSQARLIFNSGREGLLPAVTGRVTARLRTPWVAFVVFLVVALGLVYGFGWNLDPVTFFGDAATLGAIPIIVVYLVANLALPVYYRRVHPDQFAAVRHLVLPLLGVAAIAFPLYELIKPGQPAPFDRFPWVTLGLIIVGLVYALILNLTDRTLGQRIGSIVADAD
ncbi:MAG TPA: APC family permease [Streptosporangiaceae bacterium]|nr:APC family permease [Streptosporangiaceae bacterium]